LDLGKMAHLRVLRRVMRDIRPPTELRQSKARIADPCVAREEDLSPGVIQDYTPARVRDTAVTRPRGKVRTSYWAGLTSYCHQPWS